MSKNNIGENIRKYLIKESISRVVYHFTDIYPPYIPSLYITCVISFPAIF